MAAEEKNARANRPKSGASGEGNGSGPRVTYRLPEDEASPPSSPETNGTTYKKQPLTLKKIDLHAEMPDYNNRWSMFFGFIQIGLGVFCFIFGIVLIVIRAAGGYSAIGIWGGIIFIGSGAVGVFSFRKPLASLVIACFALCAISVVIAFILFIMLCYFTNWDDRRTKELDRRITFFGENEVPQILVEERDSQHAKVAVGVLLIIFALAELVIAILQGLLAAKVFLTRGPQRVPSDNPNRYSASNPIPAAAGEGDQEWGEYNAKASTPAQPTDQEWGEYNPPARQKPQNKPTDQDWGEYKPQPRRKSKEVEPRKSEEGDEEWAEYKPQKGRKAQREAQQKGRSSNPNSSHVSSGGNEVKLQSDAGRVTYNPSEEQPSGEHSPPMAGGVIRRKATASVNVEEDNEDYRESYDDDHEDYDVPPPAKEVSPDVSPAYESLEI